MKKVFFSVATLVAAMSFTACSSDLLGNDPYAAEGNWNEDGTGYMTLNIQLPTQNAARANDKFDDGLESEYAVNKAILVIFGSDTDDEKSATFASAYTLGNVDPENVDASNITNHRKYTTQITRMGGTYAWAMVILNPGSIISENSHSLNVNGANFTGTVEDLQKTLISGLDNNGGKFHDDGFLMLNAPLWKSQGGSASSAPGTEDLYYLSRIDRTKIYGTMKEAEEAIGAAAVVNVERAVAKVTMQPANGAIKEVKDGDVVTNPSIKGLKWEVLGWELDNTNKSSYLLRNMTNYKKEGAHESGWEEWTQYYSRGVNEGEVDHFRFVGADKVKCDVMPDIPALYRTYFAIDPNYASYNSLTSFNRYENATGEAGWNDSKFSTNFGDDYPKYCGENTFNLANQIWGATTRVVLKVQLGTPNSEGVYPTFYTLEENGASAMYDAEGIGTLAATQLLGTYSSELVAAKQIKSLNGTPVTVTYGGKSASGDDLFTTTWANNGDNKVEFRSAEEIAVYDNTNWAIANGGKYKCTQYGSDDWNKVLDANNEQAFSTKQEAKDAGWKTAEDETTWDFSYLNSNYKYTSGIGTITVFQNGIAYYETRIKHFGDDGCPWKTGQAWETPQPSVSVGAYPGDNAEANYLGRWGVLRNNWYDLTVNSISKIGSPVPPELKKNESNTDDELEQFISVDVNILAWAKRTQGADL